MTNKNEKLMIIDGNALIHRSFHALPLTMRTRNGLLVNAVYGFVSFLLKALKDIKPQYVILTLDKKGPTFRHKEYEAYKAHRIKAPDELYEQIPLIKNIVNTFKIPIFELEGFEADDLIGTISKKINNKIEKIIVTGDMDTLQLIDDCTKVYVMSRGINDAVIYDKQSLKARYGIEPLQMIDYKGLKGDPSDNIPGVKGIGEKIALELLQQFGNLENLYEQILKNKNFYQNLKIIKPRIVELLTKYQKEAFLSKRLATINTQAPIKIDLKTSKFGNFKKEDVIKIFSDLEFKSLITRLAEIKNNKEDDRQGFIDKFTRNKNLFNYKLIDNKKDFEIFFKKLKKQKFFAIDTETTNLDPLNCELLGISFSWKGGEAYYIKLNNKNSKIKIQNNFFETIKQNNHYQDWLDKIKLILEDERIEKFGHNIKYDLRVLKAQGINLQGIKFDSMIASYLLNPGSRQHNLDNIVFNEFSFEKITKEDLLGEKREKIEFIQVPVEKLAIYSCEDVDFTNRLVGKLKLELKRNNLEKLFNNLEMPLISILASMENYGIKLDSVFLKNLGKKIKEKIEKLEKKIWQQAGVKFNINSTQQLREVLYNKLKISTSEVSRGKTGFSTSSEDLLKIKSYHPIISLIQEFRELTKLMFTYIDSLPKMINQTTNRLHTTFNQTITATGRLSSSDPNLQNIPIRTDLGKKIRQAFIAEKNYEFLSLDYSQIELRLAAHISEDSVMINAFKNNSDIHTITAAKINKIDIKKVTPEMRRAAKAINFGILYGQGAHGLSQTAGISYKEAKIFIENYFKEFRGIKDYIDKAIEIVSKQGYAETLLGRKRFLPEINSSSTVIKRQAERIAINMPLQGTAADIIKMAMIEINKLIENKDEIKMLLQVHDELLFEVSQDRIFFWAQEIKKIMENIIKLKVPIVVDVKRGKNWGEMFLIKNRS